MEMNKDVDDELNISLRKFEESDVDDYMVWASDDYMVWASDDKVSRFCTWNTYTNKQDLLTYMTEAVIPHPWTRAICLDGRPIGAISVSPSTARNEQCKGEMGYVLASAYWGKGIVTKAVQLALERVFGEVEGLERVEALVDVDNVGSQRVLEKVGFTREGVLRKYMVLKGSTRDMVMFSFLSTDHTHTCLV